jgi:hypothetical protein
MLIPRRKTAGLLLLLGLAACSNSHNAAPPSGSNAGADAGKAVADHRGDLPAGFPLPSAATGLQSVTVGTRITANMHIQDGPTDYAFWKQKLVASGYTLTESTPTPNGGQAEGGREDCRGSSDAPETPYPPRQSSRSVPRRS